MKKPKLRELFEALRSFFSLPYTSSFPRTVSEVPDGFRGRPRFYEEFCVGCKACVEVCPAKAIDVEDIAFLPGKGIRKLTHHYDVCIFCGQCEEACITEKGIMLSKEYDLASDDRAQMTDVVSKDLLFCELCGSPVSCVDHIRWIAKKIGLLAYSNPTLFLTRNKEELKVLAAETKADKREIVRADQLRVTCPACRRDILFREQW